MPEDTEKSYPSIPLLVAIFVILLALLGLTVLAAEFPLGAAGLLIALAIAVAKALLVILYFMQVRYAQPVTWVFVTAGFVWLALLFSMTLLEYVTR